MTDMRAAVLPWQVEETERLMPDAQMLLDIMAGRGTTGEATEPWCGSAENVAQVEDMLVPGGASPVLARMYRPDGCAGGPLLLWFHGGGFVAGGLDSHDVPLRALANRASCAIVAVAYRLAPAHPHPAAVEDAAAAIRWAGDQAAKLGLDPSRLVVGGDSAGGHVAIVGTMLAVARGAGPVALQLLVYPDADARRGFNHPSWSQHNGIVLDRPGKEIVLDHYLPPGINRTQPLVSPSLALPEDLHGMPATLIVTAEFDPQRDEGELYATRLRAAGVRVALTRYPGMIHGFLQMAGALEAGRTLIDQLAAAIRSI